MKKAPHKIGVEREGCVSLKDGWGGRDGQLPEEAGGAHTSAERGRATVEPVSTAGMAGEVF